MLKRAIDFFASLVGLLFLSPLILPVCFLVWVQDWHSPFYIPQRVGKHGRLFSMLKLRSMVVNADKSGVDSTRTDDNRITPVGKFIRACKLDEVSQLYNVLLGDMSLVGPRPNVKRETDLYSSEEKKLLSVKPGITDFSSIVFSDLASILNDHEDANIAYNQLVRPWKSRLGLIYIQHQSFFLDIKLILLTILCLFSKKKALVYVYDILKHLQVSEDVLAVVKRDKPLVPSIPPGLTEIVQSRQ